MTELEAQRWMRELAGEGAAKLPDFGVLWTRAQLAQEFERRERLMAPVTWVETALECAAGVAFAFLLAWWR